MNTKEDHSKDEEVDDNTKGHSHDENTTKTTITPLSYTHKRGSLHVFSASKGQGTMPSTSTQKIDKGKQNVKVEEEDPEIEREFELIHIDSDEENETIISNSLLQKNNAQIKDLEAELEREKDAIHFYQMENKQMSA